MEGKGERGGRGREGEMEVRGDMGEMEVRGVRGVKGVRGVRGVKGVRGEIGEMEVRGVRGVMEVREVRGERRGGRGGGSKVSLYIVYKSLHGEQHYQRESTDTNYFIFCWMDYICLDTNTYVLRRNNHIETTAILVHLGQN